MPSGWLESAGEPKPASSTLGGRTIRACALAAVAESGSVVEPVEPYDGP
jgi:hypothetical protein